MAVIVVGGHSRNVGKTSVVAGLISALPDLHWTAIKITQYGHGMCSANGEPCDCATADHSVAISEERSAAGDTDTSRFVVAGADHVYWIRTRQDELAPAMPRLRQLIDSSPNTIIESNSVMRFLRPALYIAVLDPASADFKDSARFFLDRASALLMHDASNVAWQGISLKPVRDRPMFRISEGNYVTPEIAQFVRASLSASRVDP